MKSRVKPLLNAYLNYKSFKSDEKLFVIESDDWGSIRMPNIKVRDALNRKFPHIKEDKFSQFDSLADISDLEALFSALMDVKRETGKIPVITANTCMANPDFKRIEDSDFTKFHYEPFYQTILRKTNGVDIIKLWKEGQNNKLFHPQLHGREHINAPQWLKAIQDGDMVLNAGFRSGVMGLPLLPHLQKKRRNFQAALDYTHDQNGFEYAESWIRDSARMFKAHFGYASNTFIAPAYIWSNALHSTMLRCDIKATQGIKVQYQPRLGSYKKSLRFTGKKEAGVIQLVRNAFFELTNRPSIDWLSEAKKQIDSKFNGNEAVIFSTHRVNFIGSLDERNRTTNIKSLKELLLWVVKRYPDVEFITSDELNQRIVSKSTSGEI